MSPHDRARKIRDAAHARSVAEREHGKFGLASTPEEEARRDRSFHARELARAEYSAACLEHGPALASHVLTLPEPGPALGVRR